MSNNGWLQTGADSLALQQRDQEEFQERSKGFKLPHRFFLKRGEETELTFIDGDLDRDGNLTPPRFFEHCIQNADGKLVYYVCPKRTNPKVYHDCPLCNSGDKAYLVAMFTVIDHSIYTNQETGDTYQDRVRLFAAKPQVFDMLNFQAKQNDGLGCARFRVQRLGQKAAATGDTFDFIEKEERQPLRNRYFRVEEPTEEMILEAEQEGLPAPVPKRVTNFIPVDYAKDIPFYTPDQLADMGLGQLQASANANIGGRYPQQAQQKSFRTGYIAPSQQSDGDETDYSTHL